MINFELLTDPFVLRAIYGAILIGITCAAMGVFLTLRKESFLAEAVSHGSLAGVAFAFLLSAEPFWLALLVGVSLSLLITYFKRRTVLDSDSIIGIFFPMLFALGIILLSSDNGYRPELQTYLFGSLLAIGWPEIIYAFITLCVVAGMIYWLYPKLVYATFDPVAAHIRGIPVQWIDYLLAVLFSVTIIIAVKAVGIVLVTAFLVIPATTARLVARKFSHMIPIAILHNVVAVIIGITIAPNSPPGAMIVLVSGGLFVGIWIWKSVGR